MKTYLTDEAIKFREEKRKEQIVDGISEWIGIGFVAFITLIVICWIVGGLYMVLTGQMSL